MAMVRSQKKTRMPRAKTSEWARTFRLSSPASPTKDITFSEITGKTQGITFRMMPPRKAARTIPRMPPPKGSFSVVVADSAPLSEAGSSVVALVAGVAVAPAVETRNPELPVPVAATMSPANSTGAAVSDSCLVPLMVIASPATVTAASAKASRTRFCSG